jgi:hypothetical protein
MRNRGDGTFAQVLPTLFRRYDRHGCVAADFGSPAGTGQPDGRPDLYCTVGADQGTSARPYPKELWLRDPVLGFTNQIQRWGALGEHDRGRAVAALDVNRDGLPDLAAANMASALFFSPNRLYLNRGGRFEEVIDPALQREAASECVASFVRQDGYPDLFFCARPAANAGAGVLTFRNAGDARGTLREVTQSTAYRASAARHLAFADMNGDNRPDLILLTFTKLAVWFNVGDQFPRESFAFPLREAHHFAVCDIDGDPLHRPDLYVVEGKSRTQPVQYPDFVLLNDGSGRVFAPFRAMPQAGSGDGDIATCLPNWRGTGFAAVLVTNGKWMTPGPNQFLVFSQR